MGVRGRQEGQSRVDRQGHEVETGRAHPVDQGHDNVQGVVDWEADRVDLDDSRRTCV